MAQARVPLPLETIGVPWAVSAVSNLRVVASAVGLRSDQMSDVTRDSPFLCRHDLAQGSQIRGPFRLHHCLAQGAILSTRDIPLPFRHDLAQGSQGRGQFHPHCLVRGAILCLHSQAQCLIQARRLALTVSGEIAQSVVIGVCPGWIMMRTA